MDMYLENFMPKTDSLKTLAKAKTVSSFCFPCSEGLISQHNSLWFTFSRLTCSDLPGSAKCEINDVLKSENYC